MARGGDRIRMPSSGAGITQYWDEVKTRVEFKPEVVVVLAIAIIVILILLHSYGNAFFS